ncbi:MAG TPA: hypothetical protein VM779_16240 [Thermoanaerobaculia bacterium]|nr:hypothetical protein [Thermoanaerobaculia bacterium]
MIGDERLRTCACPGLRWRRQRIGLDELVDREAVAGPPDGVAEAVDREGALLLIFRKRRRDGTAIHAHHVPSALAVNHADLPSSVI